MRESANKFRGLDKARLLTLPGRDFRDETAELETIDRIIDEQQSLPNETDFRSLMKKARRSL